MLTDILNKNIIDHLKKEKWEPEIMFNIINSLYDK